MCFRDSLDLLKTLPEVAEKVELQVSECSYNSIWTPGVLPFGRQNVTVYLVSLQKILSDLDIMMARYKPFTPTPLPKVGQKQYIIFQIF